VDGRERKLGLYINAATVAEYAKFIMFFNRPAGLAKYLLTKLNDRNIADHSDAIYDEVQHTYGRGPVIESVRTSFEITGIIAVSDRRPEKFWANRNGGIGRIEETTILRCIPRNLAEPLVFPNEAPWLPLCGDFEEPAPVLENKRRWWCP